jgi:hypothetical protein
MTLARIHRVFCLAGLALGLVGAYACSLNPQPLPPGETADGGDTLVGHDASTFGPGADSGGNFGEDGAGGSVPDASVDGAPAVPPEGGDASDGGDSGDAGDGASDGATDALIDGPADAPTDGEEGGG